MSLGKYWPLFALIQLVNLPLTVVGWGICLWPHLARASWLWWNEDDDAKIMSMSWWNQYTYIAWRNPVSNLRHIPGVSKPGRPLWLVQRTHNGVQQHRMAGWLGSTGYPVCQIFWSDGAW
jgi:hypothetical protein